MVQVIGVVREVRRLDVEGAIFSELIAYSAVPDDVRAAEVIRVIPSCPGRKGDVAMPAATGVVERREIAIRPVVRSIKGQAVARIHVDMGVRIAGVPAPVFVDGPRQGQFQAPFLFFIEVFRFVRRNGPVPADDVVQMAAEDMEIKDRLRRQGVLDAQVLGIARFRFQVTIACRRAREIELVVEAGRREDAGHRGVDLDLVIGLIIDGQARRVMRTVRTVVVDAQARRKGPLANIPHIFYIACQIVPLFVKIIGFFIGAGIFRPGRAGREAVCAYLPCVLPFQALRTRKVMIRPPRAGIVIEITDIAWCRRIFPEMPGQAVVVVEAVHNLVAQKLEAVVLFIEGRTVAVAGLVKNLERQGVSLVQLLVQPQGQGLVIIIAAAFVAVIGLGKFIIRPLVYIARNKPARLAALAAVTEAVAVGPPRTGVDVERRLWCRMAAVSYSPFW